MNTEKNKDSDYTVPPEPQFKSIIFSTGIGYVIYHFLRNDWIWAMLTDKQKEFVKKHNNYWNNYNPGYNNPEEYQGQGGRSFRSLDDRTTCWEGRQIDLFMNKERPRRVLEIGPGSGYFTRQILDHDCVKEYHATDINLKFLSYINDTLPNHPRHSEIYTDFYKIEDVLSSNIEVDAIILLSALHHIPDREDFINQFSKLLSPNGSIFFCEPTHSLTRILQLSKSFMTHRWFLTSVVKKRNNYMTHHFCTLSETKKVAKMCKLYIEYWNVKSFLPDALKRLSAPLSRKMMVILKKV